MDSRGEGRDRPLQAETSLLLELPQNIDDAPCQPQRETEKSVPHLQQGSQLALQLLKDLMLQGFLLLLHARIDHRLLDCSAGAVSGVRLPTEQLFFRNIIVYTSTALLASPSKDLMLLCLCVMV